MLGPDDPEGPTKSLLRSVRFPRSLKPTFKTNDDPSRTNFVTVAQSLERVIKFEAHASLRRSLLDDLETFETFVVGGKFVELR